MTELADAFIMAPGGAGSLEEFLKSIVGSNWYTPKAYRCI